MNFLLSAAKRTHGREILPGLRLGERAARSGDGGCILGDELAGGALRVDQSRALQLGKGALHGIRVGTGIGCKLAHRWKLAPGRIDAGNDLLLLARDELRIDGLIGLKFPGHEVTSCAAVLSD